MSDKQWNYHDVICGTWKFKCDNDTCNEEWTCIFNKDLTYKQMYYPKGFLNKIAFALVNDVVGTWYIEDNTFASNPFEKKLWFRSNDYESGAFHPLTHATPFQQFINRVYASTYVMFTRDKYMIGVTILDADTIRVTTSITPLHAGIMKRMSV
jgi:hypothetical protein